MLDNFVDVYEVSKLNKAVERIRLHSKVKGKIQYLLKKV